MVLARFHTGIFPYPQVVNDVKSQLPNFYLSDLHGEEIVFLIFPNFEYLLAADSLTEHSPYHACESP